MNLLVAAQTENKVYEKLHGNGPQELSTAVMSVTVKAVKKHRLLKNMRKHGKTNETIWNTRQRAPQPRQRQAPNTTDKTGTNTGSASKCHNCGKPGHFRKDCKNCSFFGKYGHTAKQCADRIAKAKEKFCNNCNIPDSHNTDECFRNRQAKQKPDGGKNVRLVSAEDNNEDEEENTWDSPMYDSDEDGVDQDDITAQY